MRRFFIIVMTLIALTIFIFGAGKPQYGGTLIIALDSDPNGGFDPRLSTSAAEARVMQLVFGGGLFIREKDMSLRPFVAESYEMPDNKTFVFHLKKGIKFHNGMELTAEDVAYTYNSILDPKLKSPKKSGLSNLEKVEVVDKYTVKFVLKKPDAWFAQWNLTMGIVPKAVAEKDPNFAFNPVGYGPFKFVRYEPGNQVVLEANEDYFEGRPYLDKVVLRIIPDPTTRFAEIKAGTVDLVQNGISDEDLPLLEKDKNLVVVKEPGVIIRYIAFNFKNPYLSNKLVRQAIAYALDVKTIISEVFKGNAQWANSVLAPMIKDYNPAARWYHYDPELSKWLLDLAGYPDPDGDGPKKRFTVTYKCTTDPTSYMMAQIVQQYLADVGIDVKIEQYEWATFYAQAKKGEFDMYSLQWVGIDSPAIYRYIFHSNSVPPNGANRGFYINPEIDKLIEEGEVTMDPDKRKEIYAKLQEIVGDDAPYVHICWFLNHVVMSKKVHGFVLYPAGDFASIAKVWKAK